MASDHFCLKWNNFHNSIVSAFESLQSSEDLVDVTLMCEGRNVKAHKVILSACSPYFRNLFKETPCQHPIIILKDVLHCDLIAILQFMYQGEVLITQDGLASFLKTAELLQVSGLAGNTPPGTSIASKTPENATVPAPSTQPAPPLVPMPIASPPSPRPTITKTPPEVAPPKPTEKENPSKKEEKQPQQQQQSRFEPETEPIQSCSYQSPETVVIKQETEDQDFEDMDYTMIGQEHIDDPGPATEEQSILERSLKAQGMSPHSSKLYTMDLSIGPQISTIPSPNHSTLSPHPELMKNPCVAPLVLVTKNNTELTKDTAKRKIKPAIEPIPSNKKMLIKSILPKVELKTRETKSEPSPPRGDVAHGAQFGKCPHCTKVYSNQSALKYHVRLVHSDMLNMFCCHLCPESFEYRESYKAHMWDKHSVRN